MTEHCEYGEETDSMTRVQFLAHIKDKNLKFKLYRKDELTLPKLLGVVSQYHDKEALVLVPEEQVNRAEATNKPIIFFFFFFFFKLIYLF